VSVPPQQKLQLKEGQIIREHIDIGKIAPVCCQATNVIENLSLFLPDIEMHANL
jgi:hypothetical protein